MRKGWVALLGLLASCGGSDPASDSGARADTSVDRADDRAGADQSPEVADAPDVADGDGPVDIANGSDSRDGGVADAADDSPADGGDAPAPDGVDGSSPDGRDAPSAELQDAPIDDGVDGQGLDRGPEGPAAPPTAVSFAAIGQIHMCAGLASGGVKCWGYSGNGELGLGTTSARGDNAGEMGNALPFVDFGAAPAVRAVSAGEDHSCAVFDNGAIKCWGRGAGGRLGLGDGVTRGDNIGEMGDALPFVDLGTGRTATAVAVALYHTCALLNGGDVKCWGNNFLKQLGLGDSANHGDLPGQMGDALPPVSLGTGRTALAIAVGRFHSCALLDNHAVKCWGYNLIGPLGLGDTATRGDAPGEMGDALPAVSLGTGRTALALTAGGDHTCALLDGGDVKCWGSNSNGELGLADKRDRGSGPGEMGDALPIVNLGAGRTARMVSAGGAHTCALLDDATIKCWGANGSGQLGQGDVRDRGDVPGSMGDALPAVKLGTGRTARSLVTGTANTCAILDDGGLKCWGAGNQGQLGTGGTLPVGLAPNQMGDALPFVVLAGTSP